MVLLKVLGILFIYLLIGFGISLIYVKFIVKNKEGLDVNVCSFLIFGWIALPLMILFEIMENIEDILNNFYYKTFKKFQENERKRSRKF